MARRFGLGLVNGFLTSLPYTGLTAGFLAGQLPLPQPIPFAAFVAAILMVLTLQVNLVLIQLALTIEPKVDTT